MFVLGVHYCVQLLPEVIFFQTFPLPFPLLKLFSFTFLVSFIWNSQKCPISQNIWCLIKTQEKNSIQTIFQRGSPRATLIHNSMFVLGVHYCVQLLPEVFFSNIPFTVSFAKAFFFYGISMVLLLDIYVVPMGFPWCFYDMSGRFLWDFWREFYGILMGFPLDSYGSSIVFLWCFYDVSMVVSMGVSIGFLWDFYWIAVGFPRCFHNVSMIFLWDYYGNSYGVSFWLLCYFHFISMIFLWDFCGIPMGFPWYFYDLSIGFLWYFYEIPMGFKKDFYVYIYAQCHQTLVIAVKNQLR